MLVSTFLSQLKSRGQYSTSQTVLTDSDYIDFANRQMQMVIIPKILSVRQSYFQSLVDYALTSSRRYRTPRRAVGGRISRIQIISGSQQIMIPMVDNKTRDNSPILGFRVSQGQIYITGTIPVGSVMRVFYPCRPPLMSATATALGTISSVGSSQFNLSSGLTGTAQIIRGQAPYRTITANANPVVSGSPPTVDSDCSDYTRFQSGDIAITRDATHYVPLQDQLCDWLLQRTHMRVLQTLGYSEQIQIAGSKLADIQKDCLALISPRVLDQPKLINGMQIVGWR